MVYDLWDCVATIPPYPHYIGERGDGHDVADEKEPANFILIRKEWFAKQRPDWSSKVSQRFKAGAIKNCVTAHITNIKKRLKNPKHHYIVKNRSLQHNKTETLDVESSNIVLKIEPIQVSGNRAECMLYLGNNMAAHGGIRIPTADESLTRL
jgi:hypothetical protein